MDFSLRSRLSALVIAATVPSALAGLGATYLLYQTTRSNASANVQHIARTLLQTTEALVQDLTTTAEVLALSPEAVRGDFQAFRPWVEEVLAQKMKESTVVITDRNGRQRFNTAASADTPLPERLSTPTVIASARKVFEEEKSNITDLFYAPVLRDHRLVVHTPIFQDGKPAFMLGLSFKPSLVEDSLKQAHLPNNWTVAVFDTSNRSFARLPQAAEIGRPASPSLRPALEQRRDQVLDTVTLEGASVLTGVAYSQKLGWSVAVGVPYRALFRPVQEAVTWIAGIGALTLLLALLAATRLAREVISGETHRDFLINELNHRVKNSLSMLQSVSRQTLRHSQSLPAAQESLEARIMALSKAHDLLTNREWRSALLTDVFDKVVRPFGDDTKISRSGPAVKLSPASAVAFSLVLNELATNAAKYGALSKDTGRVDVSWDYADTSKTLRLVWKESGGPVVANPDRRGFGTTMIREAFSPTLTATLDFAPEGLTCEIVGRLGRPNGES